MLWTAFAKIGKLLQNAQNRVSASPDRGFLKGRTRHFGFQNTPFYWGTEIHFSVRRSKIRAMTRRSLGVGVATINTGPTTGQCTSGWATTGQPLGNASGWATTGQLSPDPTKIHENEPKTNRKRKENEQKTQRKRTENRAPKYAKPLPQYEAVPQSGAVP
jgi:hypothetical protein